MNSGAINVLHFPGTPSATRWEVRLCQSHASAVIHHASVGCCDTMTYKLATLCAYHFWSARSTFPKAEFQYAFCFASFGSRRLARCANVAGFCRRRNSGSGPHHAEGSNWVKTVAADLRSHFKPPCMFSWQAAKGRFNSSLLWAKPEWGVAVSTVRHEV